MTAQLTLLIVDDDVLIRAALKRLLKRRFEIIEFEDGKPALEYVEAEGHFDGIISDMMMPTMTGAAFYRGVESHLHGRPFILYTGSAPDVRRHHPDVAAKVLIVEKSGTPDALFNAVDNALTP